MKFPCLCNSRALFLLEDARPWVSSVSQEHHGPAPFYLCFQGCAAPISRLSGTAAALQPGPLAELSPPGKSATRRVSLLPARGSGGPRLCPLSSGAEVNSAGTGLSLEASPLHCRLAPQGKCLQDGRRCGQLGLPPGSWLCSGETSLTQVGPERKAREPEAVGGEKKAEF